MKKSIYLLLSLLTIFFSAKAAPEVSFTGWSSEIIPLTPERSTGLDKIYVARQVSGLTIIAPPFNGKPLTSWQVYDTRGGGYATELTNTRKDGDNTLLVSPQGDMGYILTWPDATFYFWLTDYSRHQLVLDDALWPAPQDCSMLQLTITGQGEKINYYTVNGRQMVLDRNIKILYNNLEWDSEQMLYKQKEDSTFVQGIGSVFISPPPLCNTDFTIIGDRFLERWNATQIIHSAQWHTNAVEVHTSATRINKLEENSNQIGAGQDADNLGGSAPSNVSFRAYISDAVLHSEWQFASDPQFQDIINRFNQQDLDYTFNEEGVTYVRFVGSNADGSCTAEGDTYTVNIGASELRCPNSFSPGASEGVNDEWKVSYRSLIEFKCWIFDRYGNQLFYFEDPQLGWDGKHRGKLVPPGVYFYVIEATGSDGKKYKKGGDINILRYNPTGRSSNN